MIIPKSELDLILTARHKQPHAVLGMHTLTHKAKTSVVCRVFIPDCKSCALVDLAAAEKTPHKLEQLHEAGFFEGIIPGKTQNFTYRLRIEQNNGEIREFWDPYSFLPTLSEGDVYLIGEGNNHRVYEKLGAHFKEHQGVQGVAFAVWAPSAQRVSVVGDFNYWNGLCHPMRTLGSSGIWELFIPGIAQGVKYKYELVGCDGYLRLKTDPYGTYFEAPPHNASIVWDSGNYAWHDNAWLEQRARTRLTEAPISIYEVHLGSWKRVVEDGNRPLNYRELAAELVDYVKEMGFTHVELMPVAEHPFAGSWGYQVTGFFAPTHRYGSPQDFMFLVDTLHQNNIGIIVDWVPAHFPRDTFALAEFDGTHLYEHADPRQGQHQDWGTLIFNYGRHEVRNFLIGSALSWFDRFHIDGLRVDAVASMLYLDYSREEGQWIPNAYGGRENIEAIEFLRQTNDLVHQYYPGSMMIAEESTAFGGVTKSTKDFGLGFDFKWNMGWMHDSLEYFSKDPIHRQYHHNELTFGMLYQYSENFINVFSHDEVVHGKGSMILKMGTGFEMSKKAADLRTLYVLMWLWPGKNTLFMGSEFGQSSEWHYDESLQWHLLQYADHEGVQHLVRDLNQLYVNSPSLAKMDTHGEGFRWINGGDTQNSVLSFLRLGEAEQETFAVIGNFTPVQRSPYRIGVPHHGFWREVINSNASCYGGDGTGNAGGKNTDETAWDGQKYSLDLYLPGHSVTVFKFEGKG